MISKQSIIRYLQKYKYSIILVSVLFILAFLFRASIKEVDIKSVFWAFINTILLTSTLILFSKTILRIPFIILFSLLVTFEVSLFYVYHNPLNYGVVASIFATNSDEARDMIKIALPASIITFSISLFLLFKSSFELRQPDRKALIISFITFVFILFVVPTLPESKNKNEEKDGLETLNKKNKLLITDLYQKTAIKYPLIIGDILVCGAFWEQNKMFNKDITKNKTLPEGVILQTDSSNIDKFILVIGESSTSQNYSLYGYPLKTTPFLDSLSINNDLFNSYPNVISPAPYTIEALKISLSFASTLDLSPFFNHKNIINLAEDAGYTTTWLSNHKKYDSYNSYISTIAMNANKSYFQESGSDDFGLLRPLKDELKKKEKQFIVVHLYGSHIEYEKRYDKIDEEALSDHGEYTHYNRSIHHTDRVLSSIYNEIKKKEENIIIFYFSDHGEVINKGHAFLNKYKIQYQIPLIVIQNKKTIDINNIIQKYYNQTSGRLNTSSSSYIISEILGYNVADSLVNKSKADGEYVYQPDGKSIKYDQVID